MSPFFSLSFSLITMYLSLYWFPSPTVIFSLFPPLTVCVFSLPLLLHISLFLFPSYYISLSLASPLTAYLSLPLCIIFLSFLYLFLYFFFSISFSISFLSLSLYLSLFFSIFFPSYCVSMDVFVLVSNFIWVWCVIRY